MILQRDFKDLFFLTIAYKLATRTPVKSHYSHSISGAMNINADVSPDELPPRKGRSLTR